MAAVVVVALKGLFRQFSRLVQLWRICKPDAVSAVPWLACNSYSQVFSNWHKKHRLIVITFGMIHKQNYCGPGINYVTLLLNL